MRCPACLDHLGPSGFVGLASHLAQAAARSDSAHVRWLNQNISRSKMPTEELSGRLERYYALGDRSISDWIIARFVERFYGPVPHPFVRALQHPSRATLLGYVVEHQHFLRQWVRSCAYIMARTDRPEVVHYELDNLTTEYGGFGPDRVAHYELLLQMGESLGLPRARTLAMPPLPATRAGIEGWQRIATETHWVEALAAMHSLELIANRDLVDVCASSRYFDPAILSGDSITDASKAFLREGYEADVGHSGGALALVRQNATDPELVRDVQSTFLRSVDLFDDYLIARLERGREFED
ncbi:MAG TPA: C2H2 type zinc finger domain-containing protein [Thermoplasmata archaeon]|nr:C2H2 type zinc finger domain-containing protein [Thermoplasmata archaeon]